MKVKILKCVVFAINIGVIGFYVDLMLQSKFGLPKAYNNFMATLTKNKETFMKSGIFSQIEGDFEKRKLPTFSLLQFENVLINDKTLSDSKKREIVAALIDLLIEIKRAILRDKVKGRVVPFGKYIVKPSISISKEMHIVSFLFLGLFISVYLFISKVDNMHLLGSIGQFIKSMKL